jgi:hypothetical protein
MLRTRGHTIVLPDGSVRFPHKLAAVFGLLGFSVGGSLNIVGGLIIAARHEKRQPRTAARLLMSELEEIASELRVCIMVRTWPTQIQTKQWAEFESRLAKRAGQFGSGCREFRLHERSPIRREAADSEGESADAHDEPHNGPVQSKIVTSLPLPRGTSGPGRATGRLLCRSTSRQARRPLSPLADLKR